MPVSQTPAKEDLVYKQFLDALIKGDRNQCSGISNALLESRATVQDVYEDLIRKALYDIGELWEQGKISVATEHMASAISEALINEFYAKIISGQKINKTVVVGCVENEYHQIGIKMVADVFEMNGWNAHFLGANTPTQEFVQFVKEIQPDMIALSLSLYFNLPYLEKMIQAIREEFPGLFILVGGQAFRHGGKEVLKAYRNISYQPDLKSVELFIRKINKNG